MPMPMPMPNWQTHVHVQPTMEQHDASTAAANDAATDDASANSTATDLYSTATATADFYRATDADDASVYATNAANAPNDASTPCPHCHKMPVEEPMWMQPAKQEESPEKDMMCDDHDQQVRQYYEEIHQMMCMPQPCCHPQMMPYNPIFQCHK